MSLEELAGVEEELKRREVRMELTEAGRAELAGQRKGMLEGPREREEVEERGWKSDGTEEALMELLLVAWE